MTRTPLRLIQSASAAAASQVWRVGVTLATHMILRRIISPDEMSVWHWAEPTFILLAQLRDLGVPGQVVRMRDRPYGTFLRIEGFWGGSFSALVFLLAPVLSLLFAGHDADTAQIVRALALFLFVQGLGMVPLTYLEAEQRLIRAIPAELARNIVFAALSLVLALYGFGIWSVVLAHIVAATLFAAMVWKAAWPGLRAERRMVVAWPLILTSLPIAVMSILELSVLYLEPLLLGLVMEDREAYGKATMAIQALYFFSRLIADAVGRAVYPALVAYRADVARSFELFRIATLLLLTLVVPTAFCFFFNAEMAALILGGEKWAGAAAYLRVAAFVPFVRPLTMFGRELLLTVHRDRMLIAYTLLNLLSLGGLGYYLVSTELREIGMAVASYFPLGALLLAWGLFEIDRRGLLVLARQTLELYLGGFLLFLPLRFAPADPSWARVLLSCLMTMIFVALALWRHRHGYRAYLGSEEPTIE